MVHAPPILSVKFESHGSPTIGCFLDLTMVGGHQEAQKLSFIYFYGKLANFCRFSRVGMKYVSWFSHDESRRYILFLKHGYRPMEKIDLIIDIEQYIENGNYDLQDITILQQCACFGSFEKKLMQDFSLHFPMPFPVN